MKHIPRLYQWEGAHFLERRPGALCGLECGLGKTLLSILALALRLGEDGEDARVLVVCPPTLKDWWLQEAAELGLPVTVYSGMVAPATYQSLDDVGGIVLAHYQQFVGHSSKAIRPLTKPLLKQKWDIVVLDEAHWIKNRKAQRTKMIKLLKTRFKWGLSGTLVAEFPQDLWSLLNWVAPGEYSSYWTFVDQYCLTEVATFSGRSFRRVVGVKPTLLPDGTYSTDVTLATLRRNTEDLIWIRTREDVGVELPPLTISDVPLTMPADQAAYYHRVKTETVILLVEQFGPPDVWDLRGGDDSLVIRNAAVRFGRLMQVSSDPTVFFPCEEHAKRGWLLDYLESGGRPAVIFTHYVHTAEQIEHTLQEQGATGFTVGTYDKMAEGLNLQAYDTLIAWDPSPSRMKWEQARYRIHRMGQERPCQIYRLMTSDIDRRAWRQIDFKETTVQMIVAWLRKEIDDYRP